MKIETVNPLTFSKGLLLVAKVSLLSLPLAVWELHQAPISGFTAYHFPYDILLCQRRFNTHIKNPQTSFDHLLDKRTLI